MNTIDKSIKKTEFTLETAKLIGKALEKIANEIMSKHGLSEREAMRTLTVCALTTDLENAQTDGKLDEWFVVWIETINLLAANVRDLGEKKGGKNEQKY